MGLFKNYVSQTRKPEGFLGKMMLGGMNCGHGASCRHSLRGHGIDPEIRKGTEKWLL